jgi:surfeit locus 1 family protein
VPETARPAPGAAAVFTALLAVVVAAACVALGLWQLRRMHEKRALNAARSATLMAQTLVAGDTLPPLAAMERRRVTLRGRYDESRQVLLVGRDHAGEPGVHVVTPLVLGDSVTTVLVDRGWMAADDPMAARPRAFPEPGVRAVTGLVSALPPDARAPALIASESDSVTLWLAERLDRKVLAGRFPRALAPVVLTRLPGAADRGLVAEEPPVFDEMKHLSYAVQWFAIALAALVAPVLLARQRQPHARHRRPGIDPKV